MTEMFTPDEIDKARQLLELFGSNKLAELSVSESDGFSIEIVAAGFRSATPQPALVEQPSQLPSPLPQVVNSKSETTPKSKLKTLNSPMVGIFYTSGAPGDPPLINVGDVVTVGQPIGLIEAMKVFSEIPAELAGRVVEILAVSGALVQQSEPLFRIEPV